MHHGLDDDCATCNYQSNFGVTGNINKATTYTYIAERVATFLQAIMNNIECSLAGTSRFVECKNKRHNCNTGDDDNSCENSDQCN